MDAKELDGQTIKGYELAEKIGVGGFGAVYRAYQPLIKREVAVKVILPDYTNNAEFVRRFEAEAQLVANLEHPHIVPLYDYWRDPNGAFLVMRWLRGGSMKAVLSDGHWPLEDIPRVLDQIAGALAVAHRNGVIHRDIKPENILLDEDRNAYLADFGIAKDLNRISDAATFIEEVESERLVGSPEFMSPEQIQMSRITSQSDIYSLGIVLYVMLTGRKPFEGPNISQLITKQLFEQLPHLHDTRPDLPEALNDVIETATEKTPDHRYDSVLGLARAFREALGATPTQEIKKLETLSGWADMPDLATLQTATVGHADLAEPENPYKGLQAFKEADASEFYGRTEQVEALLDRLSKDDTRARFLVLIGASGSGKSSLVRAGLLPALRSGGVAGSDRWFITDMTPGAHPLEELEAALLRVAVNPPPSLREQLADDDRGLVRAAKRVLPGGDDADTELVLLIDQFEEIFTQVEREADRTHFLDMLAAAANDPNSRLRIVVTLRADFYDRPLMYPSFGGLVRECNEVVLPLTQGQLQAAIVEPARAQGVSLEDKLVAAILADVSKEPGILPMMQYALTELFERREARQMTLAAYQDIGGVAGALARRADEIYNALTPTEQTLARQIFVRLVTLGEGNEDTRRRANLSELLSLEEKTETVQYVLDRFGAYRLLTFDHDPASRQPTVEVAHEALLRQWDQLQQWLDESRDELRTQRKLITLARDWLAANRDASYLVDGSRLETFESWLAATSLALTETERDYLAQAIAHRDQRNRLEAERAAREERLQKRSQTVLRVLAGVMTLAALVGVGLSAIALNQRGVAQENAVTAVAAQALAEEEANRAATAAAVAAANEQEARGLAFLAGAQAALAADNAELGLLLAQEAVAIDDNPSVQAGRALAEAAYTPATRRVYTGHEDRAEAVRYTPDGQRLLSGGDDGLVLLWDAQTGEVIRRMEGHTDFVWDVALNADATQALSASADGTAILWDLQTGDALHTLAAHTDDVGAVAFSPDGAQALTGGHDELLLQWDLTTGEVITELGADGSGHTDDINDIAYSNGGFTALTASEDGSVILWSLATAAPVQRYEASSGVYTVIYTPNESGMITGAFDGALQLWSFETGQPVRDYRGHTDRVTGLSLSADGTQFASSSQDGTAILWDIDTPTPRQLYRGHTDRVYDVAFHPTEPRFVTAGWDNVLRLWDTRNGAERVRLDTPTADVLTVAASPDGTLAAAGTADGRVWLWNLATDQVQATLEAHTDAVFAVAFSPSGDQLLTAGDDTRVLLWDVDTTNIIREFTGGHRDGVLTAAISPDGTQAVTGSRDSTAIIWDMATGEPLERLFGHTFQILSAAYSPDGEQIVTAARDFDVIIWDVASGEPTRTFEEHNDWVFTATFSPDGTQVLSGGGENNLILWDAASGQPTRTLEGHTAFIYDAAFSPDGRYAASVAADSLVLVWDLSTGDVIRRIDTHDDDVRSVAFLPAGDQLLTGSGDDTARLWQFQLTVDELLAWIDDNRDLRAFTCAEREQYNISPLCPTPTPIVDPGTV